MKFKKQVAVEVLVGVFTFAVIAVLLALTTVLSEEKFFRQYTHIEVVFDSVGGLRKGDEVNARGVIVGKVKQVLLKPDGVHVYARLDTDLDLREDYRITVMSGSVLGGHLLAVFEGSAEAAPLPLTGLLKGSASSELLDTATKTILDIQRALNDGILADLKASMAQIRTITASLGAEDGNLRRLMADGQLYADVQQIAANIRTLSDRLTNGEGTLGRLLSENDQVYQDLAATIAQIRGISESVGRGEGSVGKLLADEELYQQIQSLLREGRAAVDDIRETSPITTFTSIFFGVF